MSQGTVELFSMPSMPGTVDADRVERVASVLEIPSEHVRFSHGHTRSGIDLGARTHMKERGSPVHAGSPTVNSVMLLMDDEENEEQEKEEEADIHALLDNEISRIMVSKRLFGDRRSTLRATHRGGIRSGVNGFTFDLKAAFRGMQVTDDSFGGTSTARSWTNSNNGQFSFRGMFQSTHSKGTSTRSNASSRVPSSQSLRSKDENLEDESEEAEEQEQVRKQLVAVVWDLFERRHLFLDKKHQSLPNIFHKIFDFDLMEPDSSEEQPVLKGWLSEKIEVTSNWRQFQRRLRQVAKSSWFMLTFFFITLYILFVPDLIGAFGSKDYDKPIYIFNTVLWFACMLEMAVYMVTEESYSCSVAFVLDLVALLSFLSDTWLYQGYLFGNDQGTKTTRYARSARIARLTRLAKVAKWTRFTPKIVQIFGHQKQSIAKTAMKWRLRRMFRYLDGDQDGVVNLMDLKVFFITVLQESNGLRQVLNPALGPEANLSIIKHDVTVIREFEKMRKTRSILVNGGETSASFEVELDFEDFVKLVYSTHVGRALEKVHMMEARNTDGGWLLTQHFSSRFSLKVCVAVLLTVITFNLLQPDVEENSSDIGLAQLAVTAEHGTTLTELCEFITTYTARYTVLLLFLNDVTYVNVGSGQQCTGGGVARSELDPFVRMSELADEYNLRDEGVYKTCYPDSSVVDQEENECDGDLATSGVLINVDDETREAQLFDVYETLLVVGCLILWTFSFSSQITTFCKTLLMPLRALADDMKALTSLELVYLDGDIDDEKLVSPDMIAPEVREIQVAFKSMRQSIRYWAKMVPPSVVARLFSAGVEAKIGVSPCTCSILFCDIENFEESVADLPVHQVLEIMHSVFTKIGEVVDREGGTFLEFIGDEILAVYNAPTTLANHTYHAAQSAVDINKSVSKVALIGERPVHCRIGIHTARVLAGNMGASRRMKYGLLGDGVNLAARLKGLNSRYNTLVLATDTVMDDITKERILFRPVDKVAVKGRGEPTTVFEILGMIRGRMEVSLKGAAALHTQAFNLYQARQFAEAKAMFVEVRAMFHTIGRNDEPSRQMAQRCNAHLRSPPPPDWDGVERLTAKTFVVPQEDFETEQLDPDTLSVLEDIATL